MLINGLAVYCASTRFDENIQVGQYTYGTCGRESPGRFFELFSGFSSRMRQDGRAWAGSDNDERDEKKVLGKRHKKKALLTGG